jgi:hypothetical protein
MIAADNLADPAALRGRVASCGGSDRELDAILYALRDGDAAEWQGRTLMGVTKGRAYALGYDDHTEGFQPKQSGYAPYDFIPHYTRSVDAAIELVGRMLPSWYVADIATRQPDATRPRYSATLMPAASVGWHFRHGPPVGLGNNRALAILDALLTHLVRERAFQPEPANGG